MDSPAEAAQPAGVDLLALVRRFEPVLRFTSGELFFPMPADAYLARAALWRAVAGGPELLVGHGDLTAQRLAFEAAHRPGDKLFLRYAPAALSRKDLRTWRRRPDRPKFSGVSRMAAVGLLGRVIDSGMRLSLTLRGRVPGGLAAAAQMQYATTPAADAYHARVSCDGGYTVIQYWFLYAMNDWRSSFSGVNDHESDWEQVTVYLADRDGDLAIAWLAFSSHDETGDELRRRADDPDIEWIGTHPVVNAGAGSHSGAYLAGDYLVRVQPPALARVFGVLTAIRSALFPWTRSQPSLGVGIPYIDYRRGDGVRIGPGTDRPWTPILIDADTPWVRDYRGLWGLDTEDPFGGERAPAGPRYERNGTIRTSWADPVGWAGLDKVPPTERARREAVQARLSELDGLIGDLDAEIAAGQEELRRAAVVAKPVPLEQSVAALRVRRREAVNERDLIRQAPDRPAGPHDHLRHRALPDTATPTNALLRFWSGASLSVLLILLGLALLVNLASVPWILIGAVAIVMGIEALLRGRLALFLLGFAILVGLGVLVWLFFTHLRLAFGVLALVAAIAIGVANLRNTWAQR